ncbi:Nmad5 family putative nucleotide modification protein [Vreelandella venusta]|uniref:Nmad5 family putative nucleotide modification protein n=1 Tax=Vreelandella venusta TaxID=44935 RepID=UPI001168EB79|nr:Nmad5 family putative nucleotide modification protein [Halomonas venusta]GEK52395.1 hypothetical protein HVE01_31160 [Halomonas venusta]
MSKVSTLKTNQNKVLEPKSVRLTQAHRNDMINAVMAEWEKQNPAPALPNKVEMLKLVAKEVKKHPVYKSTQRILNALEHDDLKAIRTESSINVQFVNKQGHTRNTAQYEIPYEMAESLGLVNVPISLADESFTTYSSCLHDVSKILGFGYDVKEHNLKEDDRIKYRHFSFFHAGHAITVVLDDESVAMQKMKLKRKEREVWSTERSKLQSETTDLLAQFNTTKQLRDGWPEMVPYMPAHIADPTHAVKLPVLATSRLNERLGIK